MGFLDSLLGLDDDKPERKAPSFQANGPQRTAGPAPFRMSLSFNPLRLSAMKNNKVDLVIRLTNMTGQKQMVSVDALLPRNALLGFDRTSISKAVEKRLGHMEHGQSVEVAVPVWANGQTKGGNIPIKVHAYAHYLDYEKVMSSVSKGIVLRVV